MKYDPAPHNRRLIRLKGYDYSLAGAYFVTICTQYRACFFGDIVADQLALNDSGIMVEHWFQELIPKFPAVETDEDVIMPNHFDGIILITDVGANTQVCPYSMS